MNKIIVSMMLLTIAGSLGSWRKVGALITLESYHPLSHLGEMLYKDSVAERNARLQQETERARQQAAVEAYERRVLMDARVQRAQQDVNKRIYYQQGVHNMRVLILQVSCLTRQLSGLMGGPETASSTLSEVIRGIKGLDTERLCEIINSPKRQELDLLLGQLNYVATGLRQALPGGVQAFSGLPTSAETPGEVRSAVIQLERLVGVASRYGYLVRQAAAIAQADGAGLSHEDYEEIFIDACADEWGVTHK